MPDAQRTVYIAAGPSRFGTRYQDVPAGPSSEDPHVVWMPPARRGDAQALTANHRQPGVLALADGTFHSYPSIGHVELRDAIEAGWHVYGLCSMGAIRACEMQHLGMRPWGRVAGMFCEDMELPDDEVALVHGSEAPFMPFSEPLVHIREFLAQMLQRGLLSEESVHQLTTSMRERWYGERTLSNLRKELSRLVMPSVFEQLALALSNFEPYRLKQADLVNFVAAKPWLQP